MATAASLAVLVLAAVLAMMVAAALTVVAATTFVTQMVEHVLNLFIRGITVLQDDACELKRLACQWVVRVDGYAVFLNLHYLGHETMLILIQQRDDSSWIDVLMVKVTVNSKHLALHLMNTLVEIFSESISWRQGEVELLARLHGY